MSTDDPSRFAPPLELRIPLSTVVDTSDGPVTGHPLVGGAPAPSALAGGSPGLSTGATALPIAPTLPDLTDPSQVALLMSRLFGEHLVGSSVVPVPAFGQVASGVGVPGQAATPGLTTQPIAHHPDAGFAGAPTPASLPSSSPSAGGDPFGLSMAPGQVSFGEPVAAQKQVAGDRFPVATNGADPYRHGGADRGGFASYGAPPDLDGFLAVNPTANGTPQFHIPLFDAPIDTTPRIDTHAINEPSYSAHAPSQHDGSQHRGSQHAGSRHAGSPHDGSSHHGATQPAQSGSSQPTLNQPNYVANAPSSHHAPTSHTSANHTPSHGASNHAPSHGTSNHAPSHGTSNHAPLQGTSNHAPSQHGSPNYGSPIHAPSSHHAPTLDSRSHEAPALNLSSLHAPAVQSVPSLHTPSMTAVPTHATSAQPVPSLHTPSLTSVPQTPSTPSTSSSHAAPHGSAPHVPPTPSVVPGYDASTPLVPPTPGLETPAPPTPPSNPAPLPTVPHAPSSPMGSPQVPTSGMVPSSSPFGAPFDLGNLLAHPMHALSVPTMTEPSTTAPPFGGATHSAEPGFSSRPSYEIVAGNDRAMDDSRFARELGRIAFDPYTVRKDFPILRERVHGGKPLVWLDNAATTQKPQQVIDRMAYFYAHENSNVHRAAHTLAARSTDAFERARESARRFINAPSAKEVIWVRGATEGINLLAKTWGKKNVGKGDEIVVTHLEHHANIVPWQMLCQETGAKLRVAPVDARGDVIIEAYERLLGPRTKLVSIPHVSNALGTITPTKQMVEIAHRYGAHVMVDGAQAVSHMKVDVQDLGCDWYVFSGHKVFAPTGIGVVWGKQEVLDKMPPWQGGGNMIEDVTFEHTKYQPPPWRFEAGTGSIGDAVGLGAAIEYVERIGMDVIDRYEHELLVYATQRLATVRGLTMIGTSKHKAGVLSFVLDGQNTTDVSAILDKDGIAVRSGHHCAQPILRRFGLEATVRASLAFYNVCEDIDALVEALHRLQGGRR